MPNRERYDHNDECPLRNEDSHGRKEHVTSGVYSGDDVDRMRQAANEMGLRGQITASPGETHTTKEGYSYKLEPDKLAVEIDLQNADTAEKFWNRVNGSSR